MNALPTNQKFLYQSGSQKKRTKKKQQLINCMAITSVFWIQPLKPHVISIPLYFLAVKTNVDYQIIGSFAIQKETREILVESLSIIMF